MGYDDGVCDLGPGGEHEMLASEIVQAGNGLALIRRCMWCGAEAYEASAGDDPSRPPLPPV